jgi:uncharacterized protein (DUF58 family)
VFHQIVASCFIDILVQVANFQARQTLWLTDFPPPQLRLEGLPVHLNIEMNERVELRCWVTPLQRGLAEFGRIGCRVLSNWGLWEKNYYYAAPQQTRVYPNYKPLFRASFVGSDQLYAVLA